MNIDRGKESFDTAEVQELRGRLVQLKEVESLSWAGLSKRVGIPAGTLSTWVPGKYQGDIQAVAASVNKFFLADEARQELALSAPVVPNFQFTPTAKKIHGMLRWSQQGHMVVITGEAGVGKTASIKQYAGTTPQVVRATMSEGTRSPSGMLLAILRAMGVHGYKSGGMGGVDTLTNMVMDKIAGTRTLIALDECQYLKDQSLNQIRYIYDETGIGITLAGNVEVMRRIRGGGSAGPSPFAQLHSRVSAVAHFGQPDQGDVDVLLKAWGVEHPAERAFLSKIAALPGCLRQMTMTLEAATLAAGSQDEERTLSHLRDAWSMQQRQQLAA